MCQQVPVPNLPAGVHEAGKSVEKADAIFSQERDPRFAEMFAGISACKYSDSARLWDYSCFGPPGDSTLERGGQVRWFLCHYHMA
jgi:hypothetical protein